LQPDGTHAVLLDGRPIRTPARRPLLLPSHLLAAAVAAEWAAQPPSRVRPFTMPLMSLAAMALDQPKPAGAVVDGLLRYLDTDSAAVRAPAGAGPLADAQAAAFDPVLAWAEGRFGTPFATSAAITGAPQPPTASAAVRAHLASLSPWRLAPVAALAGAAKSVLVAVAVEGGGLSAGEALALARLEERLQSEEWGVVEGGHDVDEAASAVAVLGPAAFLRLLECGE
jgi:ATP synthase F1 complex assembly factor 2